MSEAAGELPPRLAGLVRRLMHRDRRPEVTLPTHALKTAESHRISEERNVMPTYNERRTPGLGARRGDGGSAGFRRRRFRILRFHALLTAVLLALAALMVPGAASAAPGDVGVEGPSHSGTGTPTGTKRATSALWFNDGSWWGNLWDTASSDFHIFRFNAATSSWVNTGVATDTRANTHHDVLWDGTTLFVASYRFVNDGLPAQVNFPTTMQLRCGSRCCSQ